MCENPERNLMESLGSMQRKTLSKFKNFARSMNTIEYHCVV